MHLSIGFPNRLSCVWKHRVLAAHLPTEWSKSLTQCNWFKGWSIWYDAPWREIHQKSTSSTTNMQFGLCTLWNHHGLGQANRNQIFRSPNVLSVDLIYWMFVFVCSEIWWCWKAFLDSSWKAAVFCMEKPSSYPENSFVQTQTQPKPPICNWKQHKVTK